MSATVLKKDLGTGDLCNNIGLVGVSAKWSYVTASPSHHDQAIPTLSPLLFTIPIFPFLKFEEFLIYLYKQSTASIIIKNLHMHVR